jgi:formylglycine-generating enzyme required for sulfatase activity
MGVYEVRYDEYAIFRFKNRDSEATAVPGEALDVDAVARPSPPYEDPAHGLGEAGFPAVGMTQWGALQFARWLSEKTGRLYRLPTEAEWEYACRAGTTTAYPFGDAPANLGEYAWYYQNSSEGYHEPGQKKPNPWGLYDMSGNVAEWTMDQYDAGFYASLEEPARGPVAQPSSLHPRTVRGGAYDDDPEALRCANRLESNLDWKRRDPQIPKSFWWNTDSEFVGFRLVRPDAPMTIEEIRAFWAAALDE